MAHDHDHDDDHGHGSELSEMQLRVRALETVLAESGASLEAVVKLTAYFTDIAKLRDFTRIKAEFVTGKQPASSDETLRMPWLR